MKYKTTVGTFIECGDKFLTLFRADGTWGLASGGLGIGEKPKEAAVREIFEETGLIVKPNDLEDIGVVRIELENLHVTYPTFKLQIAEPFSVVLDPTEHSDCRWVTLEECYEMNLIEGFRQILEEVYKKSP